MTMRTLTHIARPLGECPGIVCPGAHDGLCCRKQNYVVCGRPAVVCFEVIGTEGDLADWKRDHHTPYPHHHLCAGCYRDVWGTE